MLLYLYFKWSKMKTRCVFRYLIYFYTQYNITQCEGFAFKCYMTVFKKQFILYYTCVYT